MKMLRKLLKLGIFFLLGTIRLEDLCGLRRLDESSIQLEIIVLSAIQNHHKRQAVRETWGKTAELVNEKAGSSGDDLRIRLRFVVGTEYCPIHPVNRVDPLSCLDANNPEDKSEDKGTDKRQELNRVWIQKMETIQKEIQKESEIRGDLLFVEMVDVYRELPEKLLLAFQKLFQEQENGFSHLLKTDDDCYINVKELIGLIRKNQEKEFAWFGNFRQNWPVNRFGKWEDNLYSAPVYPEFACGSGYILTRQVVQWIDNNAPYLKRYQGEDVSVGIWLEPLKVTKIQDKGFICGEETMIEDRFLSAPQLVPEMMASTHERMGHLSEP